MSSTSGFEARILSIGAVTSGTAATGGHSAASGFGDALTRGIVAKLLHPMSVGLKHQAGTPQGERNAAAVRDLFELD